MIIHGVFATVPAQESLLKGIINSLINNEVK